MPSLPRRSRGPHRTGGPHRLHGHDHASTPEMPDFTPGHSPASEPQLVRTIQGATREDHPLALLALASSILSVFDPRNVDPFPADDDPSAGRDPIAARAEFVASLVDVEVSTTTALMTAMALLSDDDDVVDPMRRELARRHHRLPWWLGRITPVEVTGVWRMTDVLEQSENRIVELHTAGGQVLTLVVLVNHDVGHVITDLITLPSPAVDMLDLAARSPESADMVIGEVDPADTRAVLEDAIEHGARTWPPYETEEWPAGRALVEWVLRLLPDGGTGRDQAEADLDRDRVDALVREFLSSSFADELGPDDEVVAHWLTEFRIGWANGDPHQWGERSVDIVLSDWLPRKILGSPPELRRVPEVLRAHVRWGHGQLGVRARLTDDVLAAVDMLEADYLDAVTTPRHQGPMALLDAMGVAAPVDAEAWSDEFGTGWLDEFDVGTGEGLDPGWLDDPNPAVLAALRQSGLTPGRLAAIHVPGIEREVGGAEALAELDDDPLPDETLDLSEVPGDVHARVTDIATLVDDACAGLLDREHRTAARRLLADVARADPVLFRRRSSDRRLAAAALWVVVEANGGYPTGSDVSVGDLVEWFDQSSSPAERGRTLLTALDIDPGDLRRHRLELGTPRYLTSHRRAWMVRQYELAQDADAPDAN